jgi:hypothetical protein
MSIKVECLVPRYDNTGLVITYFENKQQVQSVYTPTPKEALAIIHYLSGMLIPKEEECEEQELQCNCHEYGDGICTCNSSIEDDEQDYSYFDIDHYKEHPEQCNDITDSITVCEHCSAYISESLLHECSEMYSDDCGQAAYDAHMEDMREQAIEIGGKREILDSSHYDRLVSEGYSFTNNADNIEDYLKRYDCITVNHLTKRGCIDAYGNFACEHPEFMLLD